MTTNNDDERVGPVLQGESHGVNSLPAGSYTAQRLKHASAQHLHLTTRRVFIGPIPEAWIAGHQKSWARYRPRMLTYSSRAATFNAAQTVSEFRSLTGLDSDAPSTSKHPVSFPQPADVNDEEPDTTQLEHEAREENLANRSSSESEPEGAPKPIDLPSPQDNRVADAESYITAQSKRQDAKTFVTAPEHLDSEVDNVEIQSNDDPYAISQATTDSRAESPVMSKDYPTTSGTVKKQSSSESRQALLSPKDQGASSKQDEEVKRATKAENRLLSTEAVKHKSPSNTQSSNQQVLLEVEPEAYIEDPDQADVIHAEPTTTGMVRFELPEDMVSKGNKLKGRISEAKERVITKDFRRSKAEPGQLLKAERMLVRIEFSKHELENNYSEKLSAKAETVVLEKWREYMITCRKSSAEEEGFVLQMAKTRVLPMLATERTAKKIAHEVVLTPHYTRANFFSSLDKTIVIWEAKKRGTRIYILRPRSSASSIEWFTFLNLTLGWRIPELLRISVPDLDVILEVHNPLKRTAHELVAEQEDSDERDQQAKLTDGRVARSIINKALEILKTSEFEDVLEAWEERDERLGLTWKQYDRLEWVHGANEEHMYGALSMQDTHELEIRTKVHYPTSVAEGPGATQSQMDEPPPIEGFLVRQTSQKGRSSLMGRTFFKRLYFSTHNHLLCFSTPGKAVPPKPPELVEALEGGVHKAKTLADKIPLIYQVDPYPIKDGKISWISEGNLTKRKEHDQKAYEENQRSMHLMLEAEGYINMCNIKKVRKYKPKKDNAPIPASEAQQIDSDTENEDEEVEATTELDIQRSFELHLVNGLIVRLQAYDKVARKEWVKRLKGLSAYWKIRTAADIDLYKEVRQQNLDSLGIDEQMESIVGQTAEKWEVSKSIASPELYHMCGISCCRQITMSGALYRKPRMHSAFKKCVVVLCHGRLLIFQSSLRKFSGHERPHILHEREEVVDLKDSYIYSGTLTEDDLLYQNKTFDSNHPGHNALPRVFRSDNWTSVDEDSTTSFVVWHGRRKSFFKANTEKSDSSIMSSVRYVSSLGVPGRSMVFKARSRAERDHWVTNISMEIERLQQSEDIRIVVSK